MNILLRNCKKFSSLVLPFSPKGFGKPMVSQLLTEQMRNIDVQKEGFLYAFQSVLESIGTEDQDVYLSSVCDRGIARGFADGIEILEEKKCKVDKIYSEDVKEEIYIGSVFLAQFYDKDFPFYSKEARMVQYNEEVSLIKFESQLNVNLMTLGLNVFIKQKLSLSWPGVKVNNNAFHLVQFLAISEEDPDLLPITSLIFHPERIYGQLLSKDYDWTIINIDNFSKFKNLDQ